MDTLRTTELRRSASANRRAWSSRGNRMLSGIKVSVVSNFAVTMQGKIARVRTGVNTQSGRLSEA